MKKFCIRSGLVLFWVALIFAILYLPKERILEERSLTIFSWGDILDPAVIADFEAKTKIKVRLNYFASNEELIVKLKATGGEGYDLILSSDYSVPTLQEYGLLKPLDKTALTFLPHLNPLLLNHSFDPGNTYSLPFEWELFVLGIDKEYFKTHPLDPSWKMLFDPHVVDYKISVLNDPVESILIGAFYLFGDHLKRLSPQQLSDVISLYKQQKQWVTAYADFRADYFLATHNCPVVLSSTSYIWRAMKRFPFVDYVVPKEGTFVTIENFCLPKATKKDRLVYDFLNFVYRPESMAEHYSTFGVFPATLDAVDCLDLDAKARQLVCPSTERFEQFHFTQVLASQQELRDAWIKVKS